MITTRETWFHGRRGKYTLRGSAVSQEFLIARETAEEDTPLQSANLIYEVVSTSQERSVNLTAPNPMVKRLSAHEVASICATKISLLTHSVSHPPVQIPGAGQGV